MRSTHTFATLGISQGAYDEIADALRKAGYCHAFGRADDAIDMHGIGVVPHPDTHKLDTDEVVRFYENDFYVLSNFSAFKVRWWAPGDLSGHRVPFDFMTSEHCYHWLKFAGTGQNKIAQAIAWAPSAHEAFKIAEQNKALRRKDWDEVKVGLMREILHEKVEQHEYVRRKLLATGERTLIEDSWRDDFWGWGPDRDGQNMLGKLWMEVRAELRTRAAA